MFALLTTELCFLPDKPAGEPCTRPANLPLIQAARPEPKRAIFDHAKHIRNAGLPSAVPAALDKANTGPGAQSCKDD